MTTENKNEWTEVDTLVDPKSRITLKISERKGQFTILIGREMAPNKMGKFIGVPCAGAEHPVEDIVYSLVKAAREKIEERVEQRKQERQEKKDKPKPESKKTYAARGSTFRGRGHDGGKGGLSSLARKDAETGGHDYTGPTKRKKERRKDA